MSAVLIVGYGYVGQALGKLLAGTDLELYAIKRSQASDNYVNLIQADILSETISSAWPGKISTLVYCVSADAYSEESYRKAYVDGLRNVLQQNSPLLKRIIFVSSTAVYGQLNGEEVDEFSPVEPINFSGKVLLEAESLLSSSNVETTSLRLGGIYGPSRTRLIEQVKSGGIKCQKIPPLYTNRVHRDDCAGIIKHLITTDQLESTYLGVDTEPAARFEVLSWLAEQLGAPEIEEATEDPHPMRGNKRCSSKLLRSEGYSFLYPSYREGYLSILS